MLEEGSLSSSNSFGSYGSAKSRWAASYSILRFYSDASLPASSATEAAPSNATSIAASHGRDAREHEGAALSVEAVANL